MTGLSAIMGAVLITAGIIQIFFQMIILAWLERIQNIHPSFGLSRHDANFGLTKWTMRTAYPGLLMILVGALLLGLGSFLPQNSN